MPHQLLHHCFQHTHLGTVVSLQQHCLVVVMRVGQSLREEALLDRRQRHCAYCLIHLRLYLHRTCYLRQLCDGLVLEHLLEPELHSLLPHPRNHLNTDYRVAAQLKEVVMNTHLLKPQHFLPHLHQQLLYLVARSFVFIRRRLFAQRQQCLSIHLAIGHQR